MHFADKAALDRSGRASVDTPDRRHFLAVDAGQTGSRAVLVSANGHVLRHAEAGGLIHALAPGGAELMATVLGDLRDGTVDDGRPPDVVALGLTAIVRGTPSEPVGVDVAARIWPDSQRLVEGDGYVAWAGATGAAPGVAAMAGTGSVVVAVNERGERAETGGWAWLFGDPGSGWDIGLTALKRMLRRWDRDRGASPLGSLALAHFGADEPPEIPDRIYSDDIDRVEVARFARHVIGLANDGDEEACGIVAGSAAEFATDVAAAIGRLDWEREPVLVSTLGGIFRSGAVYRDPFLASLRRQTPREVQLAKPVLSGLGGAALLALHEGGIEATPEIIAALRAGGCGGADA
jgi:N-acetylglucosamine kinase-like BadF-type ATPase